MKEVRQTDNKNYFEALLKPTPKFLKGIVFYRHLPGPNTEGS